MRTYTDTHRWTDVKSSAIGYASPNQLRLGPLCATSGNSGHSARQTPEVGPSTCRSTDYTLHCGVGTRSPTCTSVELGTASGLVLPKPKPGPQFFTWAWVGCQVEKVFGVSIFTTSSKTTLNTNKKKTENFTRSEGIATIKASRCARVVSILSACGACTSALDVRCTIHMYTHISEKFRH